MVPKITICLNLKCPVLQMRFMCESKQEPSDGVRACNYDCSGAQLTLRLYPLIRTRATRVQISGHASRTKKKREKGSKART